MLRLRPLLGVVIVVGLVAPWVIAVASRAGWSVYVQTVLDETLGRSAGAKEGHWGPPGYHLVLLCALFWPGVLMTGLAMRRAWSRRRSGAGMFLLAWIVPAWVVFELVSTKLPHYTMPLYPAIALLSGRAVIAAASGRLVGLREWGTRIGFGIWGLVGVGILGAGIALLAVLSGFDDVSEAALITSLWYLIIGFVLVQTFRSMWHGRWVQAQLRSMIAAALMLVLLFQTLAPAANRMSTKIENQISSVQPASIGAIGYHEDSLVFLTRGRLQRLNGPDVRHWASENPTCVLITRIPPESELLPRYSLLMSEITGLNYSKGQVEVVEIWIIRGDSR
jgi:4-amino-4-deoxy-L-arabinose transferase-like glycosyltransferase